MELMEQRKRVIMAALSEVMDCYAVIGFDTDGNLIAITHTPTDKDSLAVDKAFCDWYDETYGQEPIEAEAEWECGDDE